MLELSFRCYFLVLLCISLCLLCFLVNIVMFSVYCREGMLKLLDRTNITTARVCPAEDIRALRFRIQILVIAGFFGHLKIFQCELAGINALFCQHSTERSGDKISNRPFHFLIDLEISEKWAIALLIVNLDWCWVGSVNYLVFVLSRCPIRTLSRLCSSEFLSYTGKD